MQIVDLLDMLAVFGVLSERGNLALGGMAPSTTGAKCDRIWENPPYGIRAMRVFSSSGRNLSKSRSCRTTLLLTVAVFYGGYSCYTKAK